MVVKFQRVAMMLCGEKKRAGSDSDGGSKAAFILDNRHFAGLAPNLPIYQWLVSFHLQ